MIYDVFDILITLRCNGNCLNCIELCCMEDVTGLDYSNCDMTVDQMIQFAGEVRSLAMHSIERPIIKQLFLTGGEPTLHPKLREFHKIAISLFEDGFIGQVKINTNRLIPLPRELEPYAITFTPLEIKHRIHQTVLLHPDDIGEAPRPTFQSCTHGRKNTAVLNCFGYSLCCAGDGYVRLFCLEDLVLPRLPASLRDFPLEKMDAVCQHCSFGCKRRVMESYAGRPVSAIYAEQAELNRRGRTLPMRYGEQSPQVSTLHIKQKEK